MSAEVKILLNTLYDALTVPVSSVAEYEGKRVSYVVLGNGSIERREVTVGENNDQYVQILSGLVKGDLVTLDARKKWLAT